MTITRFSPIRSSLQDVAVLQNRLNSIFHDFARPARYRLRELSPTGSFVPAVDIYEDAQHIVLKLEVPGVKPGTTSTSASRTTPLPSRAKAQVRG